MVSHTVKTDQAENNTENYIPLLLQGAVPGYRHIQVQGDAKIAKHSLVDMMKQVRSRTKHKSSP